MSVPEELVWLIAQLRGTASRRERIRLLARGWRTLRDLSPADRIAVAHELGFDGAESLVEQLSRRGGTSPAAILELLERAEDAGPEQIVTMMQDLTDPEGRRSMGERILTAAKTWVADLESWEDGAEAGEDAEAAEEVLQPTTAVVADAAQPSESEDPELSLPAESPLPHATHQDPVENILDLKPIAISEGSQGMDDREVSSVPLPEGVVADQVEAESKSKTEEPEPVAEPPEERPQTPQKVSSVRHNIDLDGVVRRLDGCPSVTRRLKKLTELAPELVDVDLAGLFSVLELFQDGWPRRRALESLFRAGAPSTLDVALALTATLSDGAQRMWALSTLVSTRDLTSDEMETVLPLATSPVLRRRIARLGAKSQKSMR